MRHPLLWMAGVDEKVLELCPTERTKFVATGGTVLTAAALATVASSFTIHQFLHVALAGAIVFGLAWGLAIMNLDRWLLTSIRRQKSLWRTLAMAIPRLFLAVIAGLVVAYPLQLRVFQKEVKAQVVQDKHVQQAQGRQQLIGQLAEITKLHEHAEAIEKSLVSVTQGAVLQGNAQYQATSAQLASLQAKQSHAQSAAFCELDGKCGTGRVGEGTAYHRKQERASALGRQVASKEAELGELRHQLLGAEATKRKTANTYDRAALTQIDTRLGKLEGERAQGEKELKQAYGPAGGLLDQIEALGVLTRTHSSMRVLARLLWLFILAVDALPAFAKTFMSLGRPSLYEQAQDLLEGGYLQSMTTNREADDEALRVIAGIRVEEAGVRRELELKARKGLTEKVVAAQRKVGETFIAVWEQTMLAAAARRAEEWADDYKRSTEAERTQASSEGPTQGGEEHHSSTRTNTTRRTRRARRN
jgi:hypothetical protein